MEYVPRDVSAPLHLRDMEPDQETFSGGKGLSGRTCAKDEAFGGFGAWSPLRRSTPRDYVSPQEPSEKKRRGEPHSSAPKGRIAF